MAKLLGVWICLIASASAHTGGLSSPNSFQSTSVLPPGISNPSVQTIFSEREQRYDASGNKQALSSPLNTSRYWSDVTKSLQGLEKVQLEGLLDILGAQNLPTGASLGRTTGDVSVAAGVYAPQFGYGFTKRFSMAVGVPIYDVRVNVQTGFQRSAAGQATLDALATSSAGTAARVASGLNNAINGQLTSMGYQALESYQETSLGDINIGGKYLAYRRGGSRVAVKSVVTLPTGVAPNADRALDVASGDGQWDVQGMLVYDQSLSKRLKFSSYGGYTVQLPDTIDKRIPLRAGDPLSPDKENVSRDLGDKWDAGVGVELGLLDEIAISSGYAYQYLGKTQYGGTSFASNRYSFLADLEPAQQMHSAVFGLEFSTVSLYRRGAFFAPIKAVFTYSKPFSGMNRNVLAGDIVSAELVAYF